MAHGDLVLVGGRIRTLDPTNPAASAIAIRGGEIVHVGTDAAARAAAPAGAEVIDLAGAAAVPGLTDSHTHALPGGLSPSGIDLQDAGSLEAIQAAIAEAAVALPAGAWVQGWGVNHHVFEATGIRGELLDRAAGGRPVLLTFYDLHTAVGNPRALALAGIDGPRHFDEGAEIVCEAGVPTGELREHAAISIARAAIPAPTPAQQLQIAADTLRSFAAVGITSTHLMDGSAATFDIARDLEAAGELSVRLVIPAWLTPDIPEEDWPELAALGALRGERWRGGVAKFFIDGVIESGTAWLLAPDANGAGTAPFWPDIEKYRAGVRFFAAAGHQIVTHAIGDRAIRETLDTYLTAPPAPGIRHRIEHVELLHPDDLPRLAEQQVITSLQPQHAMWVTPGMQDPWSLRVRDGRPGLVFPMRTLLEAGVALTFGSDWPVARFDPRLGMAEARLRRHPGERDAVPLDDEALTPLQALLGYTQWAAQAVGHDRQGVLAPGNWGDVAVFAEDPVDCPADDLPSNPVLLTVCDGEVTHRAGA